MSKKLVPNQKRLAEWIRRNNYADRDEGRFVKIIVRHVLNKNKIGDEVATFDVPAKPDPDFEQSLANEILVQLNAEATQFGGMQHYACFSVFDGSDKHVNRCIVSIQGTGSDDDDGILSEGPTPQGLVAMSQRHLESVMRISAMERGATIESLRRQNDRLIAMNEKLIESRYELLEQMTELFDEKARRDVELMKEKAKTDAMIEGVNTVKQIAPVVLNKMMGKKILPEPQAGLSQLGKVFYSSLSEEQTAALAKILSQEQLMQFVTIGDTLVESQAPSPNGQGKPTQEKS